MKQLEKEFISCGFVFKQVWRERGYAVYERRHESSENKHYEVIKVLSHNGYEMNGTKYPPSEYYPSANSWGTSGWTCSTKDEAYAKVDCIMKQDELNKKKNKEK